MKKTKIVCTIGPKTESKEMLTKMLDAGMNVMRLNFSHGDYQEHGNRIKNVREVCAESGKQCAILLDTKGPEIRTIKLGSKAAMTWIWLPVKPSPSPPTRLSWVTRSALL